MKSLFLLTIVPLPLFLASLSAGEGKWTDLFATGDFSQWTTLKGEVISDVWEVNGDGVVHFKGRAEGASENIVTKEVYDSFELEFEFKLSEGGNSGVKYRTKNGLGLEYQVLDDAKHADGQIPSHRSGSIYDLVAAPDSKSMKPVGEWNQGRIVAKGNSIEHYLNGELVAKVEMGSADWTERFEASKYKKYADFAASAGPILLQDHKDEVWFRNVRVRKIEG